MKQKLLYWIPTLIICLVMAMGGVGNLLKAEPQTVTMTALGFPLYLMPFLGVAKLLAVIALLAPGYGLLKEWAYAGLVFDMLGASWAHYSSGDPVGPIVTPLVLIVVLFVSWGNRSSDRRVGAV